MYKVISNSSIILYNILFIFIAYILRIIYGVYVIYNFWFLKRKRLQKTIIYYYNKSKKYYRTRMNRKQRQRVETFFIIISLFFFRGG